MGNSGSTIANLILGTSKKVFSIGEINNIRNVFDKKNKRECVCGENVVNCSFWHKIFNDFNLSNISFQDLSFKEKLKLVLLILFGINLFSDKEKSIEEYNKIYNYSIEKAKEIKGKQVEYIVDNSKDLLLLYFLTKMPNIDLYVLNIVRDGRGVINSKEKGKNKKLGNKGIIKTFLKTNFLVVYVKWIYLNLFNLLFLKRFLSKDKYMTLSYDNMAKNVLRYVDLFNDKFKLGIDKKNLIDNINNEIYHNFSGNRTKNKKQTEIKPDRGREQKMPKWKQFILNIICYIPNKLWVWNKKL